ncbi:hypothetical protein [Nocardia sp. NPDC059229]|uniref:hypothetical protein n=1 Tax=Nocardia sp. NPDC059229 TaxID=3346778 RepID=UPI0036A293A7
MIEAAAGSRDSELFDRIVEENREDLEADLEEREPEEIGELEALRRLIFDEDTSYDWNNTFNHAYRTWPLDSIAAGCRTSTTGSRRIYFRRERWTRLV